MVDGIKKQSEVTLGKLLKQSAQTSIFRGRFGDRPAIFKVFQNGLVSPGYIERLKSEKEITEKIDIPQVPKVLGWVQTDEFKGIAFADIDGITLEQYVQIEQPSEKEILRIGLEIAQALTVIHSLRIIHKDINPSNVIINIDTRQVQAIDFGIASLVPKEILNIDNGEHLQGTLRYMSPEQTGRINRPIDSRTDLYSLGSLLYFLGTGSAPFNGSDANEIVHKILASEPTPLHERRPDLSKALSHLVQILLEKDPDKRYQSANGVRHDLQLVADALINPSSSIELQTRDFSEILALPDKVYDRDTELALLSQSYSFAKQGFKPTVLVHGPSGIGKSVLVGELRSQVYRDGNLFFTGKFDQYKKNIPYVAFAQIFDQVIHYVLRQPAPMITEMQQSLVREFEDDLEAFLSVSAEFSTLISNMPPLPNLPAHVVRNKIFAIAEHLISRIAEGGKTIALVIDDVQWIDSESLALIDYLSGSKEQCNLLFICAYRDNEVDSSHPFIRYVDRLHKELRRVDDVGVKPLSKSGVFELLRDTFRRNDQVLLRLASIVEARTANNPFFVRTFIEDLTRHEIVSFDREQARWDIDLDAVERLPNSANVVEFLLQKFAILSHETREILMAASCVGQRFDLQTLTIAANRTPSEIIKNLSPAVRLGLVIPNSSEYGYLWSSTELDASELDLQKITLRFGHDKVQQSSHEMMPREQQSILHTKLGFALLDTLSEDKVNEQIFNIADHINYAEHEKQTSNRLGDSIAVNIKAGELAQRAGSHDPARFYFQKAFTLLERLSTTDQSYLARVYCGLAKAHHSAGDYDASMSILKSLIDKADKRIDKAQAMEIISSILEAQGRYQEAVDICIRGIRLLGIRTPKKVNKLLLGLIIGKARLSFRKKFFLWLEEDGTTLDRRWDVIMSLANRAIPSAYLCDPDMQICLTVTVTLAAYKEDVKLDNPASLITISCILNILRMAKQAESLRQVAYIKRAKNKYHPLDTIFQIVDGHWASVHNQTYQKVVEIEQVAFDKAKEEGDPGNTSLAIFLMHLNALGGGLRLPDILEMSEKFLPFFRKHPETHAYYLFFSVLQLVKNFAGKTESATTLSDNYVSEDEIREARSVSDGHKAIYGVMRAWLDFHNGDDKKAMARAIRNPVQLILPACFSGAINLMIIALAYYRSPKDAPLILRLPFAARILLAVIRWELKWWQTKYEYVMSGHFNLLLAMKFEKSGDSEKSWQKYQQAIQQFRKSDQYYWTAFGYESYGRSLLKSSLRLGYNQLERASLTYAEYGCGPMAAKLEKEFPQILRATVDRTSNRKTTSSTIEMTQTGRTGDLDTASLLKSATAISDQLDLGLLVASILRFTIENGGATYGALVLVDGEAATLEATGSVEEGQFIYTRIAENLEKADSKLIAASLVSYALRRRSDLVINSFDEHSEWLNDPRIAFAQPKSAICLPVSNAGKTYALLYLENSRLVSAFTRGRVETLKVLAAQGAIAIKNARYIVDIQRGSEKIGQLNERLEKILESTQSMAACRQSIGAVNIALSTIKEQVAPLSQISCTGYIRVLDGKFQEFNSQSEFVGKSPVDINGLLTAQNQLRSDSGKMVLPVKWQNEFMGLLVFEGPNAIQLLEEDKIFLRTVLQSLALSLANVDYQIDLEAKVNYRTRELNAALDNVSEKKQKIQAILDHIDQGILTIDSNLSIEEEHSAFLSILLDKPSDQIVGAAIENLFLPLLEITGDQSSKIRESIGIIVGEDELNWDLNESNLPRESKAKIGNVEKLLAMDWKPIADQQGVTQKLMMTVRDITEQRRMEERLSRHEAEQQKRMERIAGMIAAGPAKTADFFEEAQKQLKTWRDSPGGSSDIAQFKRVIHTIKGTARSFGLGDIAETCHQVESDDNFGTSNVALENLINEIQEYQGLSKSLFSRDNSGADRWNIMASVGDMISKSTALLKEHGVAIGEILVSDHVGIWPQSLSQGFSGMLTHCLNNVIDHGYLLPIKRGKTVRPFGLTIESRIAGTLIEVTIKDQGAGLDLEKLSKIANERNISNPLDVPFLDEVSTAEIVSITSGRGVGLAAVREWARRHGGDAKLYPAEGIGTVCYVSFQAEDPMFEIKKSS